jgi:hypothetical protein
MNSASVIPSSFNRGRAAFKERRLGQPSVSKLDGWEAVIPWATDRRGYINFNFGAVSGDHGFAL